jgi:methylenetetrahydrofolate dehydrogenase (NADP+) / methenyltetrahydrofolate cyclohydrolase
MTATLIEGKVVAAALRADVSKRVADFKNKNGYAPGLAVVLVGEDPASQVYVRNKGHQTAEVGMASFEARLPATTTQSELLDIVESLNRRSDVHGILVQLPLPAHIDSAQILRAIDPTKDVDGFHPVSVGRLSIGEPALVPCTPSGCVRLIKTVRQDLRGLEAVIIGRSNIVGKPIAQLLLREDCTVTVAHSRTTDLPSVVRRADIVVAAVGRPEMVKADWIKPGAIVIDVGINRIASGDGKFKLVGDVAFDDVRLVAGAITPVPGGVGPMTIACLLLNTMDAAIAQTALVRLR